MKPKNSSLAFLLALLTALSVPAAFVTRAQSGQDGAAAPAARKPYAPMPPEHGHGYVINMVNGRVACRDATHAERLQILRRDPNVKTSPMRRNALGAELQPDSSDPGSTGFDAGTSNLIPGHLDIVLRPTDKLRLPENAHVLAAFERAAAVWENLITSEITVVVDVDYDTARFGTAYEENVLGSTSGGIFYIPPYSDVRNRLVQRATAGDESNIIASLPSAAGVPTDSGLKTQMDVGSPLARALGAIAAHANPNATTGNDKLGSAPSIGFNSKFNFDFDPADGIAPGKSDFDAVVVHELGHVLGFDSEVGILELDSEWTLRPTIWDLFRFRPGTTVGSFATAQRVLTTGGEQRYFDGTLTLGLSTANPEGNGGDGEQASHWKDDRLNGGVYIGIMDPTLSPGTRRQLTANDRRALDFMGYNLGALPVGPANDNFVNAVTLQGTSGFVMGNNNNATKEPGEPASIPGVTAGGRSVWYNWTSPVNGAVTFDTVGSGFDTTLSAYTGSSVTSLTLLMAHDDISTDGGLHASRVHFNVSAGAVYRIMVDGFDGDSGNITLNWTATGATPTPPPTPAPQFFNVSGRVTDASGNGVAGVRVGLSSPVFATVAHPLFTTDSGGNYSMQGLSAGTLYTVSPIADGQYSFSPAPVTFSGTGANVVFNFTASPGNPVDGSTMFVQQHYRDFLGREADSSGLGFWTGDIESCGGNFSCREAKRINVSAAFFLSIEFQETGYLVERMHKAAFGDTVEGPTGLIVPVLKRERLLEDTPLISSGVIVGQGLWRQQLDTNKTSYAQVFVQRPQFAAAYPATMTAAQFVDKLYLSAGITPTGAERTDALAAFGSGNVAGRAAALRSVAESATLDKAEKNRAFVLMQYFGYLRRNPNDAPDANFAGWNFWLGKLNEFGGDFVAAEMVKAFLDSTEYRRRFAQ